MAFPTSFLAFIWPVAVLCRSIFGGAKGQLRKQKRGGQSAVLAGHLDVVVKVLHVIQVRDEKVRRPFLVPKSSNCSQVCSPIVLRHDHPLLQLISFLNLTLV